MRGSSVRSSSVENWQSNQRVKTPWERGVGHVVRSRHQPSSGSSKIVEKTAYRQACYSPGSPHSEPREHRRLPREGYEVQ
jgi:hypothetical protein